MAKASNRAAVVRLRGAPRTLGGDVVLPEGVRRSVTVQLQLGSREPTQIRARVARIGAQGLSSLRLRLPRWTPPGRYEGTVLIDDDERRVVVEVEGKRRLRVQPPNLVVHGRANEVVTAEITISNVGNVDCDIGGEAAFGLFDPSAVDRALRSAVRSEGSGEQLIDRIAEELHRGYGGTARLTVESGSGRLEPGESRDVRVSLNLPAKLQPGRTYGGSWQAADFAYSIQVQTGGGRASEEAIR